MQIGIYNRKAHVFSTDLLIKVTNIIVKKFVKNGSINFNDFDDVKQNIIEKYLIKKEKIESAYTGSAKPETYISAVVFRMALEIIRRDKNKLQQHSTYENNVKIYNREKTINPEEELIIKNEKTYLERVLLTLGNDHIKAILFIKFYFRIMIENNDFKNYIPENKINEAEKILQYNDNIRDKEIYLKLCELHNLFEQKQIKPDAVRMYINKNIDKIINRLNNNGRTFYTKDTLSILFELLYNMNTEKEGEEKKHRISVSILLIIILFA